MLNDVLLKKKKVLCNVASYQKCPESGAVIVANEIEICKGQNEEGYAMQKVDPKSASFLK